MIEKYALIKVINVLTSKSKEFGMQEISKEADVSIGMTKLILDYLNKEKLVEKRQINNKTSLFALSDNFLTRQIKILKIIAEIHNTGIVDELKEKYKDNILAVSVFGSCADGTYTEKSDIDLLIITRQKIKFSGLRKELKLSKELNILTYSLNEWKDKAKKDNIFYEKVILNSVVLYGEKPVVV